MLNLNPLKTDLLIGIIILLLIALMIYNHWRIAPNNPERVDGLGVRDLIEQVKSELKDAEKARIDKNEAALFKVKDFDLEINFVVGTHSTMSGGVNPPLIAVSANTEISSERIQKIKLHMETTPPIKGETTTTSKPPPNGPDDIKTVGPIPPTKMKK